MAIKNFQTEESWYYRSGIFFEGEPQGIKGDRAYTMRAVICPRCGGLGGSDAWAYTGYTCYQCGGKGTSGTKKVPLYTEEELKKLNATKAKKDATLAEKRKAKEEKERLALEALKPLIIANNKESFPEAMEILEKGNFKNEFLQDIAKKSQEVELTENQANAVVKAWAKLQKKNDFDSMISELEEGRQEALVGRVNVSGYVLCCKESYSEWGVSWKILFVDERGFKIWCSAPKGLGKLMSQDADGYADLATAKGLKISFKVTLKAKEGDRYFAFGSRPSKLL